MPKPTTTGRWMCGVASTTAMLLATTAALGMTIQSGLVDHQTLQCAADGSATITLAGVAGAGAAVQGRVVGVQREVLPWADLGKPANGNWSGSLAHVPAGGPYRVEARILDDAGKTIESTAVQDILVGDVWVLAGQSNMQGVGNQTEMQGPDPLVHTFAMSYEWRLAKEPLHTLAESPDVVHANYKSEREREEAIRAWRDGPKGTGLGLPFAVEMVRRTGRPIGLIAAAHGGTSMAQWNPALKSKGGESLYGSMCRQVAAAGGRVRGVLWYQGESDANPEAEAVYKEKMKGLVDAMRSDFNAPDLPFYYVQIGRFVLPNNDGRSWNAIQNDELELEADLGLSAMVPAVDLALDDLIHVGTPGLKTLGLRLANLAEHDLFGGKVLRGPRPVKIERVNTPYGLQLRVTFDQVNGGLRASGRASGFSVSSGAKQENHPCILKSEIPTDHPNVVTLWVQNPPPDGSLWYGRTLDPYCNIVDQAGMAVPVFGPMPIPK